jgi:hypothetical protein
MEVGGSRFEDSQDKCTRPYLKTRLKAEGLGLWLKW